MKRTLLSIFLILTLAITAHAQSFKLWYANNVTDVANLDNIEQEGAGLNWREVGSGESVSIASNMEEVAALKTMFSQERMKNLDDKRQFWRMRDHTMLCFRIDDLDGVNHTYDVQVSNTVDTLLDTVDDFFFVNVPKVQVEPYEITVSRVDNPDDKIRFRYQVYGWNDEELYLFMLDQKRQVTGETYTLEYVTGHIDADGDLQKETKQLSLQSDKFQSFYVPQNSDLLDVFLMSGDKKLRLNKSKLIRGIDLNDRMNFMELSTTFDLDKHEGREMMRFNWIGTGLYEKYDTLYLSLYNEKGKAIKNATIHPERVDYDGNRIYDPSVKYDGYDSKTKQHRIVTMSNPAYIEILVDDFLPVLYKYPGAVDSEGIVSLDCCQEVITMRPGQVTGNSVVISDQHFLNLNDEKALIVRNGVDHRLCSIDDIDISGSIEADTLSYMDDCGNEFPKLLDNNIVDHYAQLEVAFSRPKGSGTPNSVLTAAIVGSTARRTVTNQSEEVVRASEFSSFTYDYYYERFDLVHVIEKGECAKLHLTIGDMEYSKFPYLRNLDFNREEVAQEAEKEVNNKYSGKSDDTKPVDKFGDAGYDLKIPPQVKFSFDPLSVTTSYTYDIRKKMHTLKVNLAYNRSSEQRPGESEKVSEARKDVREGDKYDSFGFGKNDKNRAQIVGEDTSFDDWIYDEIDDIFDVSGNRIGQGVFGGAKLCFKMPPTDYKRFQIAELAGQIGYGVAMQWDAAKAEGRFKKLATILKPVEDYLSLTANFEASAQADFGIKSFQDNVDEAMTSTNMGYFLNISSKLVAGAVLELHTPEKVGEKERRVSPLFNVKAGLRLGGKLGFRFGVEGPFNNYGPGIGFSFIGLGVGQAYVNLKTLVFHFSANAGFRFGGRLLWPNTDHNPFHNDFPYWLNGSGAKLTTLANAYRRIQAPESSELCGRAIVNNIAADANPHFLDGNRIVYNDMGSADNYNDDKVVVATLSTNNEVAQTVTLSEEGLAATNHMRSKRGEYEIVAFEQMSETINSNDITDDNAVSKNSEIIQATHIRAAIRNTNDEGWTMFNVSDDDGNDNHADLKPVVTMQEDGHAAIVYQHGQFEKIDETVSADSLNNLQFKGQLMLKTFDGTSWSSPTPLYFNLDNEHLVHQYDLMMRGDSVLVAATIVSKDNDPVLRYASKYISNPAVTYYDEELDVRNFFMRRVGKNAVISMVYMGNDSICDVYVKTIDMTGRGDGRQGNSLNVGNNLPNKVKIICDSNTENLDNFAVLWTQMGSMYRDDQGKKQISDKSFMMLNASRIYVSNALQVTDPITLGAEIDSLVITDFDGYMDDAHVSAVYTLTDITTSGSVVMYNDKYFRNSFEWDVAYGSASLMGSNTLPVIFTISNTGTSAIERVTATINGEVFQIADSRVKPFDDQEFVVNYPITDNFDGYITSQIAVDYANVFQAQAHPRRAALNYVRQRSQQKKVRVSLEDVECNVVSQTVENGKNIFLVELIDHATLHKDMATIVGVFAHPEGFESLGSNKAVVLAPDVADYDEAKEAIGIYQFQDIGGVRRAYVPIEVSGITEPIQAYVNCHLVDMNYAEQGLESMLAAVKNVRALENPTLVNLFPGEDPATFVRPAISEEPTGHKVTINTLDNGVRLNGLTTGNNVRVFASNGIVVHKKEATGSTMFVPLQHHDVYLLSTGEEIFKFRY